MENIPNNIYFVDNLAKHEATDKLWKIRQWLVSNICTFVHILSVFLFDIFNHATIYYYLKIHGKACWLIAYC